MHVSVRSRGRIEKLGDVDAPLIGGGLGALEDAGARVEVLGMDAERRPEGAAAGALGFGGERDGEGNSATTGSESTRSGRARGGGSHTLEDGAGDGRGAGGDAEPSNHGTHAGAAERRDDANIGGSSAVASDGREGRHEARCQSTFFVAAIHFGGAARVSISGFETAFSPVDLIDGHHACSLSTRGFDGG